MNPLYFFSYLNSQKTAYKQTLFDFSAHTEQTSRKYLGVG